ncbi:MAG: hypothetical protein K2V38_25060, partial [Gemmataceae bacterium]|nr:hypothetical protein [Gemmataceae bacterium]
MDTGEEVTSPKEIITKVVEDLVIGPDAAWAAWVEAPSGSGERSLVAVRWERATGNVVRQSFKPTESGHTVLSRDGRNAFSLPQYNGSGTPLELKCWNLTGEILQKPSAVIAVDHRTAKGDPDVRLSPQRTVAAVWDRKFVKIHRLPDGALLWRMPFERQADDYTITLSHVSDDGARVFFEEDCKFTILDKDAPGGPTKPPVAGGPVVVRQRVLLHSGGSHSGGSSVPPDGLANDGRSLVVQKPRAGILLLDVSGGPPPPRSIPVFGERLRADQLPPAGDQAELGTAPWAVYDRTGKELGRISPRVGEVVSQVRFLLGDRRVFVQYAKPLVPNPKLPNLPRLRHPSSWELYDTGDPAGLRRLTGGELLAQVDESGQKIVSYVLGENFISSCKFISVETGELIGTFNGLPGHRHQHPSAVPNTDWCVAITWPVRPPGTEPPKQPTGWGVGMGPAQDEPPRVITLRFLDIRTGKEVRAKELGPAHIKAGPMGLLKPVFSPDGQRVCLNYLSAKTGQTEIWIGRVADGQEERRITIASGNTHFGAKAEIRGFTPDGRLIVSTNTEVQFWNLDTGERVLTFPGHENVGQVHVAPDNSRLFVADVTFQKPRLHVWDLNSGRKVLAVDLPLLEKPTGGIALTGDAELLTFQSGRVYVRGTDGIHVLDGNP